MRINDVTLNNYQIKQLFEYFNKKLNENGDSAKYSWLIYKTCESLLPAYNTLINELYDERREPQFNEFFTKQQELIQKYADRDEQNSIIYNSNNEPSINENIVEFTEANNNLLNEYSELYERIQKKNQVNTEVYNKLVTLQLLCLDLTEFPPQTPPFIVGLLGY